MVDPELNHTFHENETRLWLSWKFVSLKKFFSLWFGSKLVNVFLGISTLRKCSWISIEMNNSQDKCRNFYFTFFFLTSRTRNEFFLIIGYSLDNLFVDSSHETLFQLLYFLVEKTWNIYFYSFHWNTLYQLTYFRGITIKDI